MAREGSQAVRLSNEERQQILRAVQNGTGGRWRKVVLFGSRTDLQKRGGDIDLLVELGAAVDIPQTEMRLRLAFEDALGERKIDLLLDDGSQSLPMIAIAKQHGVTLWTND